MRDTNKLSRSEAGKLGALASKATIEKQKAERRELYYLNPLLCKQCLQPIPYEKKSQSEFCNHSCSASFSNAKRIRKLQVAENKTCLHCAKQLSYCRNSKYKYCSVQCQQNHKWDLRKQKLVSDGFDTNPACTNAKRYIIETKGHICEICKLSEWLNQPIPLTLDHIDGNASNSSLSNLRVICPNCDRLTPNFGSKNRGNGRAWRRKRYHDGKSY